MAFVFGIFAVLILTKPVLIPLSMALLITALTPTASPKGRLMSGLIGFT